MEAPLTLHLYGAFLVKTHLSILFSFEGGAVDRRLLGQDNLRRACHGWRLSRHNLVCGGSTKDPNHDAALRIGGEAPRGGPILSPSTWKSWAGAGHRHLGSSWHSIAS